MTFRRVIVSLLATLLIAGCGETPQPSAWEVMGQAIDPDWVLTIWSPQARWESGEPITVRAELRYVGAGGGTEWFGSSSGPIAFELREIGGDRHLLGAWLGDCTSNTVQADEPLVVAYKKPGGYSADDPNAGFYEEFMADPLLRLPPGLWEMGAHAVFSMPPSCGTGRTVSLHVSVTITVEEARD